MAFYEKIFDYIEQNGIKQTFIATSAVGLNRSSTTYYTVETVYRWRTMRQSAKH